MFDQNLHWTSYKGQFWSCSQNWSGIWIWCWNMVANPIFKHLF